MTLTKEEKEEIYISLSVRCGFIETGTINRTVDLENAGRKNQIKVLDKEQMRTIIMLEDLMEKILNS